ncbi:hypothetical protein, partial [Staphylococcus epidermidis]|uniref:hypothetical protein n=1 Tax=Staphylococcus epidermidis TaxID=1282 RepID=UPI001C92D8DF
NSLHLPHIQTIIQQHETKKHTLITQIPLKQNKLEQLDLQKQNLEKQYQQLFKNQTTNQFHQSHLQIFLNLQHQLKHISKTF